MIVSAMLCWFDEPLGLLGHAVLGASFIADKLYAMDGRYDSVRDTETFLSSQAEYNAIRSIGEAVGLKVEIGHIDRSWKGQVEKRNALLEWAAAGSDWVFPLDADWQILGDREAIRKEMSESTAEALVVNFYESYNPLLPARIDSCIPGRPFQGVPLLMRSMRNMRVDTSHWRYSGEREDGTRVVLWGLAPYPKCVEQDLQAYCLFEHRCRFRDDMRNNRDNDHYAIALEQAQTMGFEL